MHCDYRVNGIFFTRCKKDHEYCGKLRWLWCKNYIITGFLVVALALFAYGAVYGWQQAEDRVDLQRQITANQVANHARMDDLEVHVLDLKKRIIGVEKTFVRYMKRNKEGS